MGDRRFHHRRRKRSGLAVVVSFGVLPVEVRRGRWWCSVRGKGEKGWRREKGGDENEGRERRVDNDGGGWWVRQRIVWEERVNEEREKQLLSVFVWVQLPNVKIFCGCKGVYAKWVCTCITTLKSVGPVTKCQNFVWV